MCLRIRHPLWVLFLLAIASALALVGAYVAQYGFGLDPCDLCLWQRTPFFAVIALGVVGVVLRRHAKALLLLASLLLLGNAVLALYHTGVEQRWWAGPDHCSGGEFSATASLADLRAQILAAPLVRCDVPAWEFHGITMASLNIVFCLGLAVFAIISLYAPTHPRPQS